MQMRIYTSDAISLDTQLENDGLTRIDRCKDMDVWKGRGDGTAWVVVVNHKTQNVTYHAV